MLAVALVAALVLAGCGSAGGGDPSSSGGGDGGEEAGPSGSGDADGEVAELGTPSLGRDDAPVVLTEYSDYQ